MFYQIEVPGLRRFVDLAPIIHALEEEGRAIGADEMARQPEQIGQRGQGPGGDGLDRRLPVGEDVLDPAVMDRGRRAGFPGGGPEERALPGIAFDQVDRPAVTAAVAEQNRSDEPREAAATAEVKPAAGLPETAPRVARCRRHGGVQIVVERAGRDEVFGLLPFLHERDQRGQALICFT